MFYHCLSTAHAASGLLFAACYLPHIVCMVRDLVATARSHSLSSELLWTLCREVSLLYVAMVAQQPLISLVVALDLLGRISCVLIVVHARRHVQLHRA